MSNTYLDKAIEAVPFHKETPLGSVRGRYNFLLHILATLKYEAYVVP